MISSTLSKFLRISNQGTEGLEEEAFLTMCMLSMDFQNNYKIFRVTLLKNNCLKKVVQWVI